MTEILTESFCERCGTRYTFESARPKRRLKGVKVLSRGLKNFVLSDDTSIDEAMAAARSETDREATAHQLDAFHKTFNFCMGCRQYTCPNCWNETEVRCLSCAPLELPAAPARLEDLERFSASGLVGESELIGAGPGNGTAAYDQAPGPETPELAADAPTTEEQTAPAPESVAAEPGAVESVAAESVAAESVAAEPGAVESGAVESGAVESVAAEPGAAEPGAAEPVAAEPVAAEHPAEAARFDRAGKAAAQTTGLLKRFRPGQSLDDELAAFERERTEVAATDAASAPETQEAVAEASTEEPQLAATVEAAQEPQIEAPVEAAQEPQIEAPAPQAAEPLPEPATLAGARPADVVEQPTWRISAPDPGGAAPLAPSSEPPATIPLQASATSADPSAEPQWPSRPQWPGSAPTAGLPFLGRPATPEGGIEALWAASNQELVTAAQPAGKPAASGIQPCISCGLSLSATARFCRRCGTLQAR